jgi:hypothetical protein
MSVYLKDSKVLLHSGSVAISNICCCTGACCIGGVCSIHTAADCNSMGGNYRGDGTVCTPNPCITGACCVGTTCSIGTASDCANMGGTYQGDGTTCSPNPCLQGACCNQGLCSIHTHDACFASGGYYQGDGTTCSPNPCSMPACCGTTVYHAFDGSGRKFLALTAITSGTINCNVVASNANYNFTITTTYSGTLCPATCSCGTGHASYTCTGAGCGDNNCTANTDGTCAAGSPTNFCNTSGCSFSFTTCFSTPCGPSIQSSSTTIVSATEQYTDYTFTFGGVFCTGTYRVYEYLSNECT